MRTLTYLLAACTVIISGCALNSTIQAKQDYQYGLQLNHFNTYAFFTDAEAKHSDNIDGLIKESIANRMKMYGIEYNEQSPDLMVSYSVHENKMTFKGYSMPVNYEVGDTPRDELTCRQVDYKLKQGTLLIQITDLSTMQCIWQGYSTNDNNHYFLQNDRLIKHAVIEIMEQCRVFTVGGEKYSKYAVLN